MAQVTLERDYKLITCIMPRGAAASLHEKLTRRGIHAACMHCARGVGRFSPVLDRGIGEQQEKDILQLPVPAAEADELFEYMFLEGDMNKPHGGFIYVTPLLASTLLQMPDLPWDIPELR